MWICAFLFLNFSHGFKLIHSDCTCMNDFLEERKVWLSCCLCMNDFLCLFAHQLKLFENLCEHKPSKRTKSLYFSNVQRLPSYNNFPSYLVAWKCMQPFSIDFHRDLSCQVLLSLFFKSGCLLELVFHCCHVISWIMSEVLTLSFEWYFTLDICSRYKRSLLLENNRRGLEVLSSIL